MNFNHLLQFLQHEEALVAESQRSPVLLAIIVGVSYLLWFFAVLWMVVQGFKQRTYGMPPLGLVSMLAICSFCAGVGHKLAPELFREESATLVWVWRAAFVLVAIVFIQYLIYGKRHTGPLKRIDEWFLTFSFGLLIVSAWGLWSFILFYRDQYVNMASPISVLIMGVGYLGTLYTRNDLRGLSVPVAWMLTLGNGLLYLGTVLGDIAKPYPGHEDTGYGFVYWIYIITMLVFVAYALLLARNKAEPAS